MICPLLRPGPNGNVTGFRWKLLVSVAIVVAAVTAVGTYTAERNLSASAERNFQHEFRGALAALHHVQELRYAEIARRCDALVHNPRIHAALEDDALDVLYFNARDQLHDLVYGQDETPATPKPSALRATFYRFLDAQGAMIPPPAVKKVGDLTTLEARQIALPTLPRGQQTGYFARLAGDERGTLNEIISVPIASSETGEYIAALMVGFEPVDLPGSRPNSRLRSGIWLGGTLYFRAFDETARAELNESLNKLIAAHPEAEEQFTFPVEGTPYLVFHKKLNPGSVFPPAYEVCLYPLTDSLAAQRRLRWRIVGLGGLVLLGGLLAGHYLTQRFSAPVERLATDSAENLVQRARAEAALDATSRELQRSARFSADASHQLKTPVTVLRAGLEEVLARDHLPIESRDEISDLIHQTYRLNGIIEDLLLLSRMDAGRLRLELGAVNLTHLIEAWLDDLSVLPDALDLQVETDLSSGMCIIGEKRYTTLIMQNLLENARKYNRPDGRVSVRLSDDGHGGVRLVIGNTGRGIDPAAHENIFERFHRGGAGENVPGHGLGLNLARELTRLHGGDLRLVRSGDDWTEFEATFRVHVPVQVGPATIYTAA